MREIDKKLRHIFNISRPDFITNEKLRKATDQLLISQEISKLKWTWVGHILRKKIIEKRH